MSTKTKFLLADDDPDDASTFCEALTSIAPDMVCRTVENGKMLFDALSDSHVEIPDFIFLDINMPVMNGWECLKKLKKSESYKDIPAIMYSTSAAKRDVDMAYELGAALFLTKPESFKELCNILHAVANIPQELLLSHLKEFRSVKVA